MSQVVEVPVIDNEEVTTQGTDEVAGAKADSTDAPEFSTKTWREDLTLVVEDRKLYVNKAVLALASPVFEAMFTAEFHENRKDELVLPGKKYKDMVEFLKCIYPNTSILNPITQTNVYALLPLANEYQVQSMKTACETCLLAHLSSTNTTNDKYVILQMACLYDLNIVKDRCIDIIAAEPHQEFDKAAKKTKFPDDIQLKIKTKALNALDIKFKDISGRYKTSRVLNQLFGVNNNLKGLVTDVLNGHVLGDYVNLKMNIKHDAKTQIRFGNLVFSIFVELGKGSNFVFVNIDCGTQCTISGLFSLVIHNWMTAKDDFRQDNKLEFSNKTNRRRFSCDKYKKELLEETNGFINMGIIEYSMYLFIWK